MLTGSEGSIRPCLSFAFLLPLSPDPALEVFVGVIQSTSLGVGGSALSMGKLSSHSILLFFFANFREHSNSDNIWESILKTSTVTRLL